jgi:hypothetical protein
MYERQSPYKEQIGLWGSDNLSGLYETSDSSDISVYWYQNFDTQEQILAIVFQELGANSMTISKYTSNATSDNPWVSTRESLAIQDGSTLASAPIGSRRDHRLYIGDPSGTLTKLSYNLTSDALNDATSKYIIPHKRRRWCFDLHDHSHDVRSFTRHPILRQHTGQ